MAEYSLIGIDTRPKPSVNEAIERAAAAAFAGEPSIDPARTRSEADYARLIRRGHCLVAHVGEAMAGFLAAEPFSRELHIWEMDVMPAFQRRGIGAGLVRAAQIDARNTQFIAAAWNNGGLTGANGRLAGLIRPPFNPQAIARDLNLLTEKSAP